MKLVPSRLLGALSAAVLAIPIASCSNPNDEFSGASTQQDSTMASDAAPQEGQDSDIPLAPIADEPEVPAQDADEEQLDATTGAPVPAVDPSPVVDRVFVEDTLNAIHTVLKEPWVVRDMSQVLSGQAAEDIENQRVELDTTGLRLVGEVSVVSTDTVESPQPGTVINDVCVDNSDVRTVDENNNVISSSEEQGRSRMLLSFTQDGQTWTLSDLSFPDDPNC